MDYECRRFNRTFVEIPVTLKFAGSICQTRILNLSINGLFVSACDELPEDEEYEATFMNAAEKPVHVRCKIVRRDDHGVGMEIIGIEDSCFENLRDLVVTFADDPAATDTQILSNLDALPNMY